MADQSPKRRTTTLIAVAAFAGVAAGAVAVYAMRSDEGNGEVVASAADCTAATHIAANIDPFAIGDLAAFQTASQARDLGSLTFQVDNGSDTTLAELGDKVMLVNLWATWCVPCRTEMPALDRLEADLGGNDFEVVAVNIDLNNIERARAFLEEIEVQDLAFYADPSADIFSDLKSRGLALGLPTTLLVDANGCHIGSLQGPAEWDSDDAKALINAALEALPAGV
ncbi:thiol:disulfide interchange protein TlpA [Bauldia sp.]|uniref:thiol:disulfide interchange protein TlpA n=1 Tax=Bauldia sp. TaxID=2575872 RepID=UPI003BA8B42E